jgi:hypothetical protein
LPVPCEIHHPPLYHVLYRSSTRVAGADVEVDGCYVGGHIRPENRKEDRKDRRLAENQTGKRQVVVAARERGGRTLAAVFKYEDASVGFIKSRVEKGTVVHTDEAKGWEALRAKYAMKVINHSLAYSADDACTNQAESFFSRLRRAQWGQHHRISGAYLGRYAAEMAWREDHRRQPNGSLFASVAKIRLYRCTVVASPRECALCG